MVLQKNYIQVIENLRIWQNKNSHMMKFIFPLQSKLLEDTSGSSGYYFLLQQLEIQTLRLQFQ